MRYATPNRDGLAAVIMDVRDVEIAREGGFVDFGESQVTFPDGSLEARVPTMVHATAIEYGFILALSDGRIVASEGAVMVGGNGEPVPLPSGRLLLLAGVLEGQTDGDFPFRAATGVVVSAERGPRAEVERPACGRFAAAFDSKRGLVEVDAAPDSGEFSTPPAEQRSVAELKLSGARATFETPDGFCVGGFRFGLDIARDGAEFEFAVPDCGAAAAVHGADVAAWLTDWD